MFEGGPLAKTRGETCRQRGRLPTIYVTQGLRVGVMLTMVGLTGNFGVFQVVKRRGFGSFTTTWFVGFELRVSMFGYSISPYFMIFGTYLVFVGPRGQGFYTICVYHCSVIGRGNGTHHSWLVRGQLGAVGSIFIISNCVVGKHSLWGVNNGFGRFFFSFTFIICVIANGRGCVQFFSIGLFRRNFGQL